MAPSKQRASASPPKKISSSSNASKNKHKAAEAAEAKQAALSGAKPRARNPPKDGGNTGPRKRVNADKENMPMDQRLEPTRKSGRLAGVPARTEKGELLDHTTAKRNTRTAVKISRQGSNANRKKLADAVADDDGSSDIEMQVPKSKGKGRNTIPNEVEDEESDSGVREVSGTTFESVPHQKKSYPKDTHKIPSTFASLESSQGGVQRSATQASSASQKSGNLEEAILGSAINSEETRNPNPRVPVIGESTSDPIFSSTPPRPTYHGQSSSTREEDAHRKSTPSPRIFGQVPNQNYRDSDGASTTDRTGNLASKTLSTPSTRVAQSTLLYSLYSRVLICTRRTRRHRSLIVAFALPLQRYPSTLVLVAPIRRPLNTPSIIAAASQSPRHPLIEPHSSVLADARSLQRLTAVGSLTSLFSITITLFLSSIPALSKIKTAGFQVVQACTVFVALE
ncbi:hypothetical protein SISSUDRAFT_1067486 [Sistotremastrum suecicum HHB10207 ss-3]|uniref:Uncharacterized protein n=1 Tax=Sistotremastrum suecicum HHB10207 ss-3 TaxID=1314776 RepID=A0A165X2A3_9AGAM|nr:hypothetical protein SISSUDRAFT_1067486 [Sistotremastrum suecicum HHB10207 ss-3]